MPRTKAGEKISWGEFFSRWKKGIEGITAYQMTKQQLNGMRIIMLGITCGIVVCFFNLKNLWWLLIILVGSLYVNVMQYIGNWQKFKVLKRFEFAKEEVEDPIFHKALQIIAQPDHPENNQKEELKNE